MNLGFFFGEGAEISYGLPSAGKFTLDLFKNPVEKQKEKFREDLKKIDLNSEYATEWLPDNLSRRPIYAFGKSEFCSLLQSSIEDERENILWNLSNIDNICNDILKANNIDREFIGKLYKEEFKKEFGDYTYDGVVKLNKLVAKKNKCKNIFSSTFYSAILDIIGVKVAPVLKKYATAILQLFVCVIGEKVVKNLNHDLFEQNETNLSIFDDLATDFTIDFNILSETILDIVLDNNISTIEIKDDPKLEDILSSLFALTITKIFEECLDYRKLIDTHFKYLYHPRTQWSKFSKIVMFLRTVREYININNKNMVDSSGYYHDLAQKKDCFEISSIGTSNYNNLISTILKDINEDIRFLNGNISTFYNPYKNSIIKKDTQELITLDEDGQIIVPFLSTQSSIKHFAATEVAQDCVSSYLRYLESDFIVCVGFGFNSYNNHINGIFSHLIRDGKKLIYVTKSSKDTKAIKDDLKDKLYVTSKFKKNIEILNVDENRMCDNKLWLDCILDNELS